jgi:hypothetical protein
VFAAVTHLVEDLSLEALLTVKVVKYVIYKISGYTETNSIHNKTTVNFALENVNKE